MSRVVKIDQRHLTASVCKSNLQFLTKNVVWLPEDIWQRCFRVATPFRSRFQQIWLWILLNSDNCSILRLRSVLHGCFWWDFIYSLCLIPHRQARFTLIVLGSNERMYPAGSGLEIASMTFLSEPHNAQCWWHFVSCKTLVAVGVESELGPHSWKPNSISFPALIEIFNAVPLFFPSSVLASISRN